MDLTIATNLGSYEKVTTIFPCCISLLIFMLAISLSQIIRRVCFWEDKKPRNGDYMHKDYNTENGKSQQKTSLKGKATFYNSLRTREYPLQFASAS